MKKKQLLQLLFCVVATIWDAKYGNHPAGMQYSFVGTTAAIIAASIAAGGSVASGIIGSKGAKSAAKTQAAAADEIRQQAIDAGKVATDTVNAATTDANAGLDQSLVDRTAGLKPYLDAGTSGLTQLQGLLGEDGSLAKDQFSFTSKDYQNDPGFAFQVEQAQRALQASAAQKGGLLTGGFARASNRNITGLANTHLDSAFNRAYQTYQTNRQNTLLRIQGLQGVTGLGYNATQLQNSNIGGTADQVARNKLFQGQYAGNTGLNAAAIGAQAIGAKADATAAGDVGSANAWQGALGNLTNLGTNAALLYNMPQVSIPPNYSSGPGLVTPPFTSTGKSPAELLLAGKEAIQ